MKITGLEIPRCEMARRRLKQVNGLPLFHNFVIEDLEEDMLLKYKVQVGEEFDVTLLTNNPEHQMECRIS